MSNVLIDYATTSRTDFLDIYLGAKCHFCLCDTVGFNAVPQIFRRPMAIANYIPILPEGRLLATTLFIPKKLWLRKDKRLLTFPEIRNLQREVGVYLSTLEYEQLGIEVVENTSKEITALALEMEQCLLGTRQSTEKEEELQRRFWAIWDPDESGRPHARERIGSQFLVDNQELLNGSRPI